MQPEASEAKRYLPLQVLLPSVRRSFFDQSRNLFRPGRKLFIRQSELTSVPSHEPSGS